MLRLAPEYRLYLVFIKIILKSFTYFCGWNIIKVRSRKGIYVFICLFCREIAGEIRELLVEIEKLERENARKLKKLIEELERRPL